MKRINKLLMAVFLVISFISFGLSVMGGLIDNTVLVLFWHLGLAELWAILITLVIGIGVFLVDSINIYFQSDYHRLKGHEHHSPQAMI